MRLGSCGDLFSSLVALPLIKGSSSTGGSQGLDPAPPPLVFPEQRRDDICIRSVALSAPRPTAGLPQRGRHGAAPEISPWCEPSCRPQPRACGHAPTHPHIPPIPTTRLLCAPAGLRQTTRDYLNYPPPDRTARVSEPPRAPRTMPSLRAPQQHLGFAIAPPSLRQPGGTVRCPQCPAPQAVAFPCRATQLSCREPPVALQASSGLLGH